VIVLDTTVLIDVLRGDQPAVNWLSRVAEVPRCSELTRIEVLRGLRSAERAAAERLFGALVWVPVLEPIAREAGELGRRYRRSHNGIGTVDLVVAATANQLGARVATANVRHYPMFRGLRSPYQ
jgi:predicted nucleic acid-binding protein